MVQVLEEKRNSEKNNKLEESLILEVYPREETQVKEPIILEELPMEKKQV